MQVKTLFKNDIERKIPGVIKIGQDDYLKQELEEYVITRELRKHFSNFFNSYSAALNKQTDDMGVWISGFFGSGKSHFLKILSYLLENKVVDGKESIEYFKPKIKDHMVYANIKVSGDVPTDVVLFNIDAKAETTGNKVNAILNVFVKTFNEMRGYCGSTPWVADLEEKLDLEGVFKKFKDSFLNHSGLEWEDGRNDILFESDSVVKALVEARGMSEESARVFVDRAEKNYSISIEKFAEKINEYLDTKERNHHIVFLVDEVGQFVGDDTQMMLKLQTLVEELGMKCKGRAWVIVTSQQDIDGLKEIKGYDFSKIQGRFAHRLSLSSANVDEVIKKRILAKTKEADKYLQRLFEDKGVVINNLLTFSSDTPEAKNYKDEHAFSEVYPFIPYQFKLLQSVFSAIRKQGASGKHLAEGERSLLSAFQDSAINYINNSPDVLVPFYAFYDTIENFLDHNIRIVFQNAENTSVLNEFDIKVLKILFMIKYVNDMPKNLENVTALMIDNINQDKLALKEEIRASLKRLKNQMLIEQNGDQYIFLTDEEQEVNKEIQNISIGNNETLKACYDIIFTEIYTDNRFRYENNYDFSFTRKLDDHSFNREEDISINFLTPMYAEKSDTEIAMRTSRENSIIVKMSHEHDFINEVTMVKRINKFMQKRTTNESSERERISSIKRNEAKERERRAISMIRKAIAEGESFVNGKRLQNGYTSPKDAIDKAFNSLIESVYTKLGYIKKPITNKGQIEDLLSDNMSVFDNQEPDDDNAYNDVKRYIHQESLRYDKTPLSKIMSKYTSIPYGWNELNVTYIIVQLLKHKRIRVQLNNENMSLNHPDLINYLTLVRYRDKVVVKVREEVSKELKNKVVTLIKDAFTKSAMGIDDEDKIETELRDSLTRELDKIERYLNQYYDKKYYPGQSELEDAKEVLVNIKQIRDQRELFKCFIDKREVLIKHRDLMEKLDTFFKSQYRLVDEAVGNIEKYNSEKDQFITRDIDISEVSRIVSDIEKIITMEEPFDKIHELNDLNFNFALKYAEALDKYAKPVKDKVENEFDKIINQIKSIPVKELETDDFTKKDYDIPKHIDVSNMYKDVNLDYQVKEKNQLLTGKITCLESRASSEKNNLKEKIANAKTINSIDALETQVNKRIEMYYKKLEDLNKLISSNTYYYQIDKSIVDYIKEKEATYTPPEEDPKKTKVDKIINVTNIFDTSVKINSKEDIDSFVNDIRRRLEKELEEASSISFR